MEIEANILDQVIKETVAAVEKAKEQIYDIAESARIERNRLKTELDIVKQQTLETIDEVDRLERQEKSARRRLMEVSKNFQRYSEADMQKAYDEARNLQINLGLMRERERQLRLRRDQLEFSLRRLDETVTKAEDLVANVGVALTYLSGNLQGLSVRLEEMQQRYQLGLRIIKAQEEERKRVAREIHDGPAQSMANLVMRAEVCEKLMDLNPGKVKEELQELKGMVKASLQEVRKIIFDLRPMVLDDLGIVPALKRYVMEFQHRTGIEVDLAIVGLEKRLGSTLEIALFRILQEALSNVAKHSRANRVQVRMEFADDWVNILIADNGCGFQVEKEMGKGHDCYGLIGMRERVELLEGKLSLRSTLGKGTQIIAQLPVKS